jgi:hypothetical protein
MRTEEAVELRVRMVVVKTAKRGALKPSGFPARLEAGQRPAAMLCLATIQAGYWTSLISDPAGRVQMLNFEIAALYLRHKIFRLRSRGRETSGGNVRLAADAASLLEFCLAKLRENTRQGWSEGEQRQKGLRGGRHIPAFGTYALPLLNGVIVP